MTVDRGGVSDLAGVPRTMLWALHNRAREAMRPDTYLRDPACVRLYESIDYDFAGTFGRPRPGHPVRAALFDAALRPWIAAHPGGQVVELGAGLETGFQRCDDGAVRWLCVDLPEAIAVRDRFLPAAPRCRHLAVDVLDPAWLDAVDPARGVLVTAQGLLMYLTEPRVRRVLTAIVRRWPGGQSVFDTVPSWYSKRTIRRRPLTPRFTPPPMWWGIDRRRIAATLRGWCPEIESLDLVSYGAPVRGMGAPAGAVLARTPLLRDVLGTVVHLTAR